LADALTTLGKAYLTMEPERLLTSWTRRALARTLPREKADVEHHYGLGNDFFQFFLDDQLTYSCAYFRHENDTLEAAQRQKVAHTLAKLDLRPGQRLLDVGCGWGHLMFEAAERYGVEAVGITLCDNQAAYVREQAAKRRLPVEVRTVHYLELDESLKWDRLVSVGMMEHVGESRADEFYDKIKALLAPKAICLLHCISKMKEESGADPFVEKYVFPGYWFFSLEGMTKRAVARGLNVIDVENLRRHYALTGRRWRANFIANYERIKRAMNFDDKFMRTWEFYLASGEAGFRIGHLNLIQMVMSNGVNDDYPLTREFLYAAQAERDAKPEAGTARPEAVTLMSR
jgi:cyclopropane-fatty-acyl-phospholipid synthase